VCRHHLAGRIRTRCLRCLSADRPTPAQADRWGVGYYSYKLSNAFRNALPNVGSHIEPQKGAEVFYNWAVTPWFRLQGDGQWVRPFNGRDNNYYLGLSAHLKVF